MTSTITNDNSFSTDFPELLERHVKHLLTSAIIPEVIRERGYKSVLRCAANIDPKPGNLDVAAFGFKQSQLILPAILMPLYGLSNKVVLYQLRPDKPRVSQATGKPIKYETPARRNMRLDIPPRCLSNIGDPSIPLFITEGIKKGDSLASAGACVVCLLGVYNWRGTNDKGGKVALPEWEQIALNERLVFIVFDSDIVDKPAVKQAFERLASFLSLKGAVVKIVKLPPGKDGSKTGVDDFIAQGHSLEEVVNLAAAPEEAKVKHSLFADQYEIKESMMFTNKPNREGGIDPLPLANFGAKITSVITRDDGLKESKFYRIMGRRENGALLTSLDVSVDEFSSLNWVDKHWDVQAIISAHPSAKAQIVQAMKLNSQDATQKLIFAHTGWREINGVWTYLTNGSAINAVEANGITVDLDSDITGYQLPPLEDPRDNSGNIKPFYRDAFAASFDFLNMGTHRVTMPLWAAMYMSPLNPIVDTCFTLFVVGHSGTYKSSITALALNHYGPSFAYNRLPGSWNFTDNKLEYLMHLLKDVPFLIDDFAPGADANRARILQGVAERVMRDQGNRTGRGRMTKDLVGRITPIPRGFLITSGEHLPGGASHNARIFAVEISNMDINRERVRSVTAEQKKLYGYAMTQYIGWLARRWDELKTELPKQEMQWYAQAEQLRKHARLPAAVAKLYAGLSMGLQFMVANGTIGQKEATRLAAEGFQIYLEWSALQSERVEQLSPGRRFLDGLISLINAGRVEFASTSDDEPRSPKPGVNIIGWRDDNRDYLLNPSAAFSTVRNFCAGTDDPLTIGEEAIWRDLKERGWTTSNSGRNRYNAYIYGRQQWVIKLNKAVLEGEVDILSVLSEG
jgi:hypothetical protein